MRRSSASSAVLRMATATTALTTAAVFAAASAQAQQALPVGGTPVDPASVSITTGANQVTVTQTSNRGVINWQSFDVAQGNTVVFNQPSATAATLNRVTGTTSSTIAGSITSNGSVYLVNPNGIAITASGNVQTGGGFVASTLDIADADFNAGTNSFTGTGASANVSNAGTIAANGFAALLGGTVSNSATISVPGGRVFLGSGEAIVLDINGSNFLQVAMPTAAMTSGSNALIEQSGTITGGRIELAAATAANAVRNVVNMTGTLNADSATGNGGSIRLSATGGGTVAASGTLTAQATGAAGNGGSISLLVGAGGTLATAGMTASTVAAGGRTGLLRLEQGSYIADAQFGGLLATNNVSVFATTGGITINDAVNWSTPNFLMLTAASDIALNAAITGSSTAGALTLVGGSGSRYTGAITATGAIDVGTFNLTSGNWSQSGTLPGFAARDFQLNLNAATFLRTTGGDGSAATPYRIADVYGLQGMASGPFLARNFVLANAIDAGGTANWNSGAGFVAIGTDGAGNVWNGTTFGAGSPTGFTGSLDGGGFAISGMTIARSSQFQGLFGYTTGGTIANLGLVGGSVAGGGYAGSLIGYSGSSVSDVTSATPVTSTGTFVGGLIGSSYGTITRARASGAVSGVGNVGGLVGRSSAAISGSSASGNVTATSTYAGGLVGNTSGRVSGSSATGNVTSTSNYAGGLIGVVSSASVDSSTASGAVSGTQYVGGLIGYLLDGSVTGGKATGDVTGTDFYVGGLIGSAFAGGIDLTISGSTASGNVRGQAYTGGLVGQFAVSNGRTASISGSSASGTVAATITGGLAAYAGGLVGQVATSGAASNTKATIDLSYATGAVTAAAGGATTYVGGLIGAATNATNAAAITIGVTNSYATGAVTSQGGAVGGLVGYTDGYVTLGGTTVNGVYATGTVTGVANVGGLVGSLMSNGTILNTYATGRVNASGSNVGGLVGLVNQQIVGTARVANSFATGAVNSTGAYAGGLIGSAAASGSTANTRVTIDGSYATGNVTSTSASGTSYVGGLIGSAAGSTTVATVQTIITNAYATGAVSSKGSTVGGLVGYSIGYNTIGSVTTGGVYATGSVAGVTNVGGLAGTVINNGVVSNAFATGRVTASGIAIGGLVGQLASSAVSYAYATGAVSTTSLVASSYVGGLVGYSIGSANRVSNAYATGAVSSGGGNVGGLIGYMGTTGNMTSNVYATGSVKGTDYVGGLIGQATTNTTTNGAYASGAVNGTGTIVGGLVGNQAGTLSNAYWDSYSTGRGVAVGSSSSGTTAATVSAVTSDPGQVNAVNASTVSIYAFNASAYPNLPRPAAGTALGTATVSGFVTLAGNSTRPFLAFEVPLAGNAGVATTGGVATLYSGHQLQLIDYNATTLAATYLLGGNIDLTETGRVANGIAASTNAAGTAFGAAAAGSAASYSGMWAGTGFRPIGKASFPGFVGTFDGGGHALTALTINRPGESATGLFGGSNGTIRNLGLIGGSVTGYSYTGGLVGFQYGGTIGYAYSTVTVSSPGGAGVGGLVGRQGGGSISNAYATGSVAGGLQVGGLVGFMSGDISNVYATGSVTASGDIVGGLVGTGSGTISNAYASGAVTGGSSGGLIGIGSESSASITNAYWDSYSTGQSGSGGSGNINATAVTSDPNQSTAANYAYKASAYANLTAATGIGTATPGGFVFVAGDTTRPFLAFEVPVAGGPLSVNSGGRVVLSGTHQLQLVGYNAATNAASYTLAGTIELAETGRVAVGTPGSYSGMWAGTGFVPLGTDGLGNVWNGSAYVATSYTDAGRAGAATGFSGALAGAGYALTNLTINRAGIQNVGLFGASSGVLSNLAVTGAVTGFISIGGVVGLQQGGSLTGVTSAVNVKGDSAGGLLPSAYAGGLVGFASGTAIAASSASGTVNAKGASGGLVGLLLNSTVLNSTATGTVIGRNNKGGGLVGVVDASTVTGGSSTGTVNGGFNPGYGLLRNGGSYNGTVALPADGTVPPSSQ